MLITGASGFIGRNVCKEFEQKGHQVIKVVRKRSLSREASLGFIPMDISPQTDWGELLFGVDVVIHLAAVAHKKLSEDSIDELELVNVLATERLAKEALFAGVKKFIFISSIGVNGAQTLRSPFSEYDPPNPHNFYAESKLKAENILTELFSQSANSLYIIRLPLVYGVDAPGNFASLIKLVRTLPVNPFVSIHNQRSLVSVYNVASLLVFLSVDCDRKTDRPLLFADTTASTSQVCEEIADSLGKNLKPLPLPKFIFQFGRALPRIGPKVEQLTSNLEMQSSKFLEDTGWSPQFGLKSTLSLEV